MGVLSRKYGELVSPLFRYINVSRSDTEVMIPGIFPTPAPSTPAHRVNAQYKHYCASSKIINSRMGSSPSYLLVHTHSDTCCCSNTVQLAASARGPSHEDPPARTVTCLPGPQLRAAARQGHHSACDAAHFAPGTKVWQPGQRFSQIKRGKL